MGYEPVFKKLPFYRTLTSVITTTLLGPPQRQSKYLTREYSFSVPEEFKESCSNAGSDIRCQKIGIQLRFCRRLSSLRSCHEIDDYIPPELEVYVNCSIPDLPPFIDSEQKLRKAHPINITDFCKVSNQNQIAMSWFSSEMDNYEYFFTIHLVEHISHEDIVKSMSTTIESDSKYLVIKTLGGGDDTQFPTNSDLCVTSLTVSLLCPLSMQKINVPSRSIYCTHVQCFDVFNYLQINEFKPSWKCPVCRDKAPFDTLVIDSMFKKILQEKNVANEIVFATDGSWEFPPNDLSSAKDSHVENDDICQQQTSDSNKPVLNLQKLRSSPRFIKKRLINNSPRTLTKSPNPSSPPNTRRRKQKLTTRSSPYISDVIKVMKTLNKSTEVVDLTL